MRTGVFLEILPNGRFWITIEGDVDMRALLLEAVGQHIFEKLGYNLHDAEAEVADFAAQLMGKVKEDRIAADEGAARDQQYVKEDEDFWNNQHGQ